jgi:hypothetical protein
LRSSFGFLIACAVVIAAAQCFAAGEIRPASPVVRVKARLTAFDGLTMSLEPLMPKEDAPNPGALKGGAFKAGAPQANAQQAPQAKAEPFTVSVLAQTRYVRSDKAALAGVKPGAYAGAAVTEQPDGSLKAVDIYLYAESLRGSGEGRFAEAGRLIVNGAVSAIQPVGADGKQNGSLTLHYHGAVLSGLGRGKTLCEGRASPPAYASALACEGDAVILVPPAAPVWSLTMGNKDLLVPGSLVTVAMTKGLDGKNVAAGVIVEKSIANPSASP